MSQHSITAHYFPWAGSVVVTDSRRDDLYLDLDEAKILAAGLAAAIDQAERAQAEESAADAVLGPQDEPPGELDASFDAMHEALRRIARAMRVSVADDTDLTDELPLAVEKMVCSALTMQEQLSMD